MIRFNPRCQMKKMVGRDMRSNFTPTNNTVGTEQEARQNSGKVDK